MLAALAKVKHGRGGNLVAGRGPKASGERPWGKLYLAEAVSDSVGEVQQKPLADDHGMRVISQSLDPLTRMYTMTKRQGKSGTIDRCWYRSILVSAAPPTSITAMRRQAPSSMPISAWPSWSLV
jgi:hypothetical protein